GDYYDFINAFRKVEGRIGTVSGAPGFITYGPHVPLRRAVPDKDFIEKRGLKIGIIHCLAEVADDPDLEIDGIEFTDFPKEMHLQTRTIKRKMGSVLLLSQPSMIEFARKIRDKGGVVIVNNTVFTRSVANEKYIMFDLECASGPEQHLAPNVMALAAVGPPSL